MPAKLSPIVANNILEKFAEENDVVFTSPFVDSKTPIKFLCKQCGQETKITWGQLQQNKNPNMLCLDCSYKQRSKTQSLSYGELRKEIEEKGSLLLTPEDEKINTHTNLSLICTFCGDTFKLRYGDYKRGRNQKIRCANCAHIVNGNHLRREAKRIPHEVARLNAYQEIQSLVEATGAVLLSSFDEYQDKNSLIRFGCSKCGKEYHIRWKKFEEGQNPNLLCADCLPPKTEYTTDFVKTEFAKHDVELLNEYVNIHTPLLFFCKQCGDLTSTTWGRYLYLKRNPYFLCAKCRKGNISSDPLAGDDVVGSRNKAATRSGTFAKAFYNVSNVSGLDAHHVKMFKQFPSLRYSLANIYPLSHEEHIIKNKVYYHCLEEARNPENWSDEARLPYHNYEGFHFFNLNNYFLTDFILEEQPEMYLWNRKKELLQQGILYFPLYFQELDVYQKAQIVYSMLRSRLAKIPEIGMDIYRYTGQEFHRYNTRKLEIREVPAIEALFFFNANHIQGFVDFSICVGLYSENTLVSAMSFGNPRSDKWIGDSHYELLRFCSILNSSVPGAASKLFKYFVDNYHPELVVSFCDCRFSSVDPNETVYPKLGFEYDGYSAPNYKYAKDGNLYSRQQFMKSKLPKKLENFDPNLSELENMRRNGYTRLYDCGNFRFVWRRPQYSILN